MIDLKTILIVEDNPQDVELMMEALDMKSLANQIIHVQDGVEALDYLRYEGSFYDRQKGNPTVILLDIKMLILALEDFVHSQMG